MNRCLKESIQKHNSQDNNKFQLLGADKLRWIIEAMVDAVLVFTPTGDIRLCNPAFEKTFGCLPESFTPYSLRELFRKTAPELPNVLTELTLSAKPSSQEIILKNCQPERIFLLHTTPIIEDGMVTEGIAIFHEITQVRQIEKMRRDFVANVSHELRTPLSAINGYAETLLDGAIEDKTVAKDFVSIIFNHSKRLANLVSDLLDLSKLESAETMPELLPVDLVCIIQKVLQFNKKLLDEKEITLKWKIPSKLPMVLANESNLEQVLTNLIDNAIKYTAPSGEISVKILLSKGFAQIDVSDTGIGIEAKHISRVFERFYRVDKARSRDLGGTGLGLAIVKHIIQNHGGEAWVNSIPGKGSTFSVTLKIA